MGKLKLYIMVGISGSGKSTHAKKLVSETNSELVETDAIREELTGNQSDQSQNGRVFFVAKNRIKTFLSQGRDVIFDATNLSVKDRKEFIEIGQSFNAEIHAVVVQTELSVAIQRNSRRDRKVPTEVIEKQSKKFVIPKELEGFHTVRIV